MGDRTANEFEKWAVENSELVIKRMGRWHRMKDLWVWKPAWVPNWRDRHRCMSGRRIKRERELRN